MTAFGFVDPHTLRDWIADGSAVLIDVREPHEYAQGRIESAVSLPLSAFDPSRIPDLVSGNGCGHGPGHTSRDGSGERRLVLHCAIGIRCGVAAGHLSAAGHAGPVWRLEGGIKAWLDAGLPIAS